MRLIRSFIISAKTQIILPSIVKTAAKINVGLRVVSKFPGTRSYSNQNSNVPRTNVIENVTEDSNEPLVQLLRQKINQIMDVEGI